MTDSRTDELVLILPRSHPLPGRTPTSLVEKLNEKWISLTAGAAGRTLRWRMVRRMAVKEPLGRGRPGTSIRPN